MRLPCCGHRRRHVEHVRDVRRLAAGEPDGRDTQAQAEEDGPAGTAPAGRPHDAATHVLPLRIRSGGTVRPGRHPPASWRHGSPAGALLRRSTRYRRAPRCARLGGSPSRPAARRARPWRPRRARARVQPWPSRARRAATSTRRRPSRCTRPPLAALDSVQDVALGRSRPAVRPGPAGQAAAGLGPRVGGRVPGLPSGRALLHGVRHPGRPARRDRAGAGSRPRSAPTRVAGAVEHSSVLHAVRAGGQDTVRLVPVDRDRPGRRGRLRRRSRPSPGSRWRACSRRTTRSARRSRSTRSPRAAGPPACRCSSTRPHPSATDRCPPAGTCWPRARTSGADPPASACSPSGPGSAGGRRCRRTTGPPTRGSPASRTSPASWRRPRRWRR